MSVRQIVFDTETTGLKASDGHRIIEIGAVEIIDRKITGKTFHTLINPERDVGDTVAIHGHTNEVLREQPKMKEVIHDFLSFIEGAELIAHNAAFDEEMLFAEMQRCNIQKTLWEIVPKVTDTLQIARRLYPKMRNNLDALMQRLNVDSSERVKHGALIDSQLLAQVYLIMTEGLDLSIPDIEADVPREPIQYVTRSGSILPTVKLSEQILEAHALYLDNMEKDTKVTPVFKQSASSKANHALS